MIWLSPKSDTQECSIYFDLRDIKIRRTGSATEGVVLGLLGDGQQELWAEVILGVAPQVNILPLWTENGTVESFDASIDEADLKDLLVKAIQQSFADIGSMFSREQQHFGFTNRIKADFDQQALSFGVV